ncbi:MAG TPA: hypothetical protein PK659_07475 [Methanothrix sp.]|mgnify:CR=1 FL=1|nr:hypothetical protein [Methanothrix sp.]HOL44072.1 hypothetical protein [Methanothrix sp.]
MADTSKNASGRWFPVKIGSCVLGENPAEVPDKTQPNPIKIEWSRKHNIKVHEIPYPAHKTIRTSNRTLYKLNISVKTLRKEKFDELLSVCEACGPHWVETVHKKMWMYVEDYKFEQEAGKDDYEVTWSITLQEVND